MSDENIVYERPEMTDDPFMQININVQSYTLDSMKIIKIKQRILDAVEQILDEERDDFIEVENRCATIDNENEM